MQPSLESKFGVFAHGNSITGKKTAFLEFARAVGKYILPFTCDSHTSIVVLGRILTGIVTSGVFCIIDKLHTQPLLTISQVVQSISLLRETAQRRESSNVPFFGRIIKIPSPLVLGCFVTIDSASAGAEEISGMLHTQMRAISFIKPAFATIAQGLLAMHCFSQADLLGAKLARLFSMMQDHLSVQNHYDFSLRTLKSVVRYVFRLRQQIKDFDETQVLCRGIAQFMYPKLVYEDVDIFMSLVYRLFNCHPRMAISDDTSISSNYEDPFYKPLKMLNSSDPEEIFQTEILQVSQLSETEQHILLLGASGTGKSTILTKAAAQLKAKIYDLNPTAFPSEVFFGHIDKKGIEVGILETVLDASRKLDPAYRRNWIVFDTEIQESWVDRLCCLVDNFRNATICFSTGKRVGITKNTTLIVETDNLKSSYSYFISRFNIIYVRQEWDVYICIDLWLSSPSLVALVGIEEQGQLRLCFSKYMKDILEGALRLVQIEVGKPALLLAHLRLLETLIQEFKAKYGDDGGRLDERYHEDLFIYSVIWSIGPMISMSKRPVLQQILLQSLIRHKSINAHLVEAMKEFNVESMFDLHFDLEELEWKPFFENISPQSNAADWGVELSKYKQIGRLLLSHQKNLVIVGETGVRKTRIGQEMLEGLKNSASMYYEPITKNSDGGLITLQFQKVLAYDEPTKTYLPPNGNKLILFIDDLQKAKRDDYGTREMW